MSKRDVSSVRFEVATEADDADIRWLLRENPMPGRISLSLEREPDFFADAHLPGTEKQTIIAREHGRVVCVGSSTTRLRFVNGQPCRVSYLGGLRLDASVAGRFDILRRGYRFFREVEGDHPDLRFTSIAADNTRALKFLERRLPGMPLYESLCDFVTLLLAVKVGEASSLSRKSERNHSPTGAWNDKKGSFSSTPHGSGWKPDLPQSRLDSSDRSQNKERPAPHPALSPSDGERVAAGRVKGSGHLEFQEATQLAPLWSDEELVALEPLGLSNADFVFVREGSSPQASAALWDQRSFKQTVIRGYSPWLGSIRPVFNLFAPLLGEARLPAVGEALNHAFVSHLAAPLDQPALLGKLIERLMQRAAQRGIERITLGFAANDPRLATVRRRFRGREYRSRLFTVRWPDEPKFELEAGVCCPEVASL